MGAIFQSVWVRKLIGKLGVPYNRRLRVRGSPHPLNYDADLSLPAEESNAFRIQSNLPCPERFLDAPLKPIASEQIVFHGSTRSFRDGKGDVRAGGVHIQPPFLGEDDQI